VEQTRDDHPFQHVSEKLHELRDAHETAANRQAIPAVRIAYTGAERRLRVGIGISLAIEKQSQPRARCSLRQERLRNDDSKTAHTNLASLHTRAKESDCANPLVDRKEK
jgi:hypothetical protein